MFCTGLKAVKEARYRKENDTIGIAKVGLSISEKISNFQLNCIKQFTVGKSRYIAFVPAKFAKSQACIQNNADRLNRKMLKCENTSPWYQYN